MFHQKGGQALEQSAQGLKEVKMCFLGIWFNGSVRLVSFEASSNLNDSMILSNAAHHLFHRQSENKQKTKRLSVQKIFTYRTTSNI